MDGVPFTGFFSHLGVCLRYVDLCFLEYEENSLCSNIMRTLSQTQTYNLSQLNFAYRKFLHEQAAHVGTFFLKNNLTILS